MDTRYRSMDFLRALAIMLVLLAHSVYSYGAPTHLAPLQFGGTGVDLFFVLSGWLLGGLLFKEAVKTGTINLRRFWIRRWMRTLPAYYTVLILQVSQRYLTKDDIDFPWEYFIFIQNYTPPLEFFSISWSLCVEEQFYLFIAPLLLFLTRTPRVTITITLVVLLILPSVFRFMHPQYNPEMTHYRLDGCVMGILLAHIHHHYGSLWAKFSRYAPYFAGIFAAIFLMFVIGRYYPQLGITDPNKLFLTGIFGAWVVAANANKYWSNFIYIPGSYYIATRSYALYLLHPETLAVLKRYFIDAPFPLFFLLTVAGTLVLAEILYRFIEKPIMDNREKFSFSSK